MSGFCDENHVKATRKPHRCAYCGREITVGSSVLVESGFYDHVPFRRYACHECEPLLDDFWRWAACESYDLLEDFAYFKEVTDAKGD